MQANGTQAFAFTLLLVGTGAIIAAIATDYWSFSGQALGNGAVGDKRQYRRGLWRECQTGPVSVGEAARGSKISCNARWHVKLELEERDVGVTRTNITDWEVVVGSLMIGAVVLGALALIGAPCCCTHCPLCLFLVTLLAGLCSACGTGFYAYKTLNMETATIKIDILDFNFKEEWLGWSFYVAVGGSACQLLAAAFVCCSCCQRRRATQYV